MTRYLIKLQIEPPLPVIVSELVNTNNQQRIKNDDDSILLTSKMEGKLELVSWLFSFGSSVNVLEPFQINDRYEHELRRTIQKYVL